MSPASHRPQRLAADLTWSELVGRILEYVEYEPDLDDTLAGQVAAAMVRTRLFHAPAARVAAAIDEALPRQVRLTGLVPTAVPRDEADFRDFLRRVRSSLEIRRPWPPWRYEQLGLDSWDADGERAVARLSLSPRQLANQLTLLFERLTEPHRTVEIAVIGIVDGPTVALARDLAAPGLDTVLLYRGTDPGTLVVSQFLLATGIEAGRVSWQPSGESPWMSPPADVPADRREAP